MNLNTQLTLNFELRDEATFENFFIGSHTEAMHALQNMLYGEGEKMAVLSGPSGAGKTHLLQALCKAANQQNLGAIYLPLKDLACENPSVCLGLEKLSIVCLDDLQVVLKDSDWEMAILDLSKKMRIRGHYLVLATHGSPIQNQLFSRDLLKMLATGVVYPIKVLTEAEQVQALIQRAQLRGLSMPLPVSKYWVKQGPRNVHALFQGLDRLDKASLQAQRKLTIPFIKQALEFVS